MEKGKRMKYWVLCFGVTGCGKSTIGKAIADHFGVQFVEGDEFHSQENVAKMSAGIPLTDEDRFPWLTSLSEYISSIEEKNNNSGDIVCVLACSALKRNYREILSSRVKSSILPVLLSSSMEVIEERVRNRKNHYAGTNLIQSQFQTLQVPTEEEFPIVIKPDITQPILQAIDSTINSIESILEKQKE